jgi:hypothetical protein
MSEIRLSDAIGQSLFDFIFTKQLRADAGLTDPEANAIYTLWKNSPIGTTKFSSFSCGVENKILTALKTKGYLAGFGDNVELTEKGKKVIIEMATHEPNAFEKHAKQVQYSSILTKKASRRGRQTFLKHASKDGKIFNLRKESIRRMGLN